MPLGPAKGLGSTRHPGRGMGVRCTLDGHASGRQWLLRSVCDHLPDEELYVPSTGTRLLWWRINGNFSLGVNGVTSSDPEGRCLSAERTLTLTLTTYPHPFPLPLATAPDPAPGPGPNPNPNPNPNQVPQGGAFVPRPRRRRPCLGRRDTCSLRPLVHAPCMRCACAVLPCICCACAAECCGVLCMCCACCACTRALRNLCFRGRHTLSPHSTLPNLPPFPPGTTIIVTTPGIALGLRGAGLQ